MARDPKNTTRQIRRRGAAELRESIAIEMYAQGKRYAEIAERVDVHPGTVHGIIERGLKRRAANEGMSVDAARALYLERATQLLRAYMPLATGTFALGEGDPPLPPDIRAGELCLKLIDRIGAVQAQGLGQTPADRPELHLHLDMSRMDTARESIISQLTQMREKETALEGELAGIADLDQLTAIDARPATHEDREQAA